MTALSKLAAAVVAVLRGRKPAFADARRRGVRMNGIAARSGRLTRR